MLRLRSSQQLMCLFDQRLVILSTSGFLLKMCWTRLCVFGFEVKAKLKIPAAKGCCFAERRTRRSLFLKQRAADRSLPAEPKVPGHNRGSACEPRLGQTVLHLALDGMKTSLSPFYDFKCAEWPQSSSTFNLFNGGRKKNQVSSAAFP